MIEDIKVSDIDTSGKKGIYDSQSFCSSIIVDVDDALTKLVGGQPVAFCNIMIQIVRKVELLRKGIADDLASKDREIADYKDIINKMEVAYGGHPDAPGEAENV